MKREIKFRGLDSEGNWHYGYLNRMYNSNGELSSWIEEPAYCDTNSCLVNEDTVGQFTGMYDSKGIEVYENDIVLMQETYLDTETKDYLYKVLFDDGSFILLELNETNPTEGYHLPIMSIPKDNREWKVIGNTYNNRFCYDKPTLAEVMLILKYNE